MTEVQAGDYLIRCCNAIEEYRAETMYTKEEGTVRWLQQEMRADDVLYDIGANIGLYSMLAAKTAKHVYAFEPHVGNASSLLANLSRNKIMDKVTLITSALHSEEGFFDFHYASKNPGTSGSQLGHRRLENGREFVPAARELKHATTLGQLLSRGSIQPATLIKLDVDGNELYILQGCGPEVLAGVRSLQVEIRPENAQAVAALLEEYGFAFQERHDTLNGKKLLAEGADPDSITRNEIFCRKGCHGQTGTTQGQILADADSAAGEAESRLQPAAA